MKKLPYWLKGGILGIIIWIIYYTIVPFLSGTTFVLSFSDMNGNFHFSYMLVPILVFLFAGIIIGLIYGKIKKNN